MRLLTFTEGTVFVQPESVDTSPKVVSLETSRSKKIFKGGNEHCSSGDFHGDKLFLVLMMMMNAYAWDARHTCMTTKVMLMFMQIDNDDDDDDKKGQNKQ